MKKQIQKLFNLFGYQITRSNSTPKAFIIQKELINQNNPTIFDIGAHQGSVTNLYLKLFPFADIHSFEPFPDSYNILKYNYKDINNIHCHNIAISNKKGKAPFYSNAKAVTNSLLEIDNANSIYWGKETLKNKDSIFVETTTIDNICKDNNIKHIDILKIDTQGTEFGIFQGAKEILTQQNISLIYTEIITCPTYKGQHKLYEYLSFLSTFGYEVLEFLNQFKGNNQLIQTDIIFLSKRFRKNYLLNYK